MGQCIAIGIVTEYNIDIINLQKYKISIDELISNMTSKLFFASDIYEFFQENESYIFKLKNEVFEKELLPFLTEFYKNLYPDKKSDNEKILDSLRQMNPASYIDFAKQKSMVNFQYDRYGMCDYIYFDRPFKPEVEVSFNTILLSLEGKIMIESVGRHFCFFKLCIEKAFSEFQLSKAIKIYITG